MSRSRLLLVAVALAAGDVGCAHCDTCDDFPAVTGADDAAQAVWLPANTYPELVRCLACLGALVFPAHRALLADALGR